MTTQKYLYCERKDPIYDSIYLKNSKNKNKTKNKIPKHFEIEKDQLKETKNFTIYL